MSYLFETFSGWKTYCGKNNISLEASVIEYENIQKGNTEKDIYARLEKAYTVMEEAIHTGFSEDMTSTSGMINNGAKKVYTYHKPVLSKEFQNLIARALSAKEVNSCMGRVVAAPTAGASGILPSVLYTLKELHNLTKKQIYDAMLVAAGIALIIEHTSSLAGSVGGCQAETGSAAAMAAGAIVYCLEGSHDQVFNAVGITIQCMLGLVCDPVAGLVEIPCVVRNASAAAIANSSAQIALAGVDIIIPADECVEAMAEVSQNMEIRYKETALGGLATTKTGMKIAKKVLIQDIDTLPDQK